MPVYRPLHLIWYLKYLFPFSLGFIFFLVRAINENSFGNIFYTSLFLVLISLFFAIGKIFSLNFEGKRILVSSLGNSLKGKPFIIDGSSIEKIFVRQGIFGKLFKVNGLFIQFFNQKIQDQYPLKFYGLPIKDASGLQFPGIWGNLLCIPDISEENLNILIKKLNDLKGEKLMVENLGVGWPWYRSLSKVSYFYNIGLLLILVFILLFFLVSYLIIKLMS